uniref:non-specific serine/threonine protein kinase n=1 Tax=Saccoglossus kowalevskii TaxID=10224 RepID=A0ABM0MY42_SACKO|nr:PREDICTED: eukaryotic translation initiation factor 2-alpha kinase 4-like [Saccoglossus kowalevskii]
MEEDYDTPQERQENELQVLKSIYMDECIDVRDNDTWKVQRPLEVLLHLKPQQSMGGTNEIYVNIDLRVKCSDNYPNELPEITLESPKGLSNDQTKKLRKDLECEAKKRIGEVMILELATQIEEFLHIHNVPQMKSFYHEMLTNKKRKEEKAAKEQQRKMDLKKRREAMQRKEIEEEIQRRQMALKEESRRRRVMSKKEDPVPEEKNKKSDESEDLMQNTSSESTTSSPTRRKRQPDPVNGDDKLKLRHSSSTRIRHDSCGNESRSRKGSGNVGTVTTTFYTKGNRTITRGKCLGQGSSGSKVYVGMDTASGELVAIGEWVLKWRHSIGGDNDSEQAAQYMKKVVSIEQELLSLLRLDNPYLVHYLAIKYTESNNCIIIEVLMEYIGGGTLATFIDNGTPVQLESLRHYAIDILESLQYLHSKGVVHKDLKASSIFIDSEGHLRIADYSIGKRISDLCHSSNATKQGVHFSDDKIVAKGGKKGDILKFGMLLLSLLHGDYITEYPVEIPHNYPPDFQDFLTKCLTTDDRVRLSPQQLLRHAFICPSIDNMNNGGFGNDYGALHNPSTVNEGTPDESPFESHFATPKPIDVSKSRLYSEFEELKWLGKGGFGDVIKVQNKLDGCFYAIKRIPLNPKSKEFNKKITREVKLLSRLNHENVVRYYNSWIEVCENSASQETDSESKTSTDPESNSFMKPNLRRGLSFSDNIEKFAPQAVDESIEWSMSFEVSRRMQEESSESSSDEEDVFGTSFLPHSDSSDIVFEHSFRNSNFPGFDDSDSEEESKKVENKDNGSKISVIGIQYLYIQMEYCEKSTLRNSIDDGLFSDHKRVWRLFREILEGLTHIHLQGMIHRDLKPVNIFLDLNDNVKIGDFGLATTQAFERPLTPERQGQTPDHTLTSPDGSRSQEGIGEGLTGKVGTALYVSPELANVKSKTKTTYNQKVDLYSLGIIFFEMCYRPLSTGMERVKVIGNLRMVTSPIFPDDFDEIKFPKQIHILNWLLDHDPDKRPTAQELLQSNHLPRPEMEDAQLYEVLKHTMSNRKSSAYRRLMNELFSQPIETATDYTYDMNIHKGFTSCQTNLAQRTVHDTLCKVFQKHGGVLINTQLLLPKSELYENADYCTTLMDHSGGLVTLPFDLRVPFARFIARNNVSYLKRYSIERVYRSRKLFGAHPKEMTECAFDIVNTSPDGLVPDAEILLIVYDIINDIPVLQGRNYILKLNHTSLLKAILNYCGIPEDKHLQVYDIMNDVKNEKLTHTQRQTRLCSLSLSDQTVLNFNKYMQIEGSYSKVNEILKPITRAKGANASSAKQGLHELEAIMSHALVFGIKLQMEISLGLTYNAHFFSGLIFQFIAEVSHKKKKIVMDILAGGGRYDKLISHFKAPVDSNMAIHTQHAVGVSLAFDKLVSAVQEETDYAPSVVDILVCVVGSKPLLKERLKVVRDLWSAGLRADLIYDSTLSLEEIQDYCKQENIPHLVMLKDVESGTLKVFVKTFDTQRGGAIEKKVSVIELVEYLQQKFQIAKLDAVEGNAQYATRQVNTSATESIYGKTGPDFCVSYIPLDKLQNHVKRRIEGQMLSTVSRVLQNLSTKANVEIIGVVTRKLYVVTSSQKLPDDYKEYITTT